MKCFIPLATILALIGVVAAVSGKDVLLRIKPISAEEYEALLEASNAEESQRSEGRIISSAIAGLTSLTAGLSMGKYINSLFGNRGTKTVGGYPLCTINVKPDEEENEGRQFSFNVDDLTSSLGLKGDTENGKPVINCVLVLDEGTRPTTTPGPDHMATTTPLPPGPTFQPVPETTVPPPTIPTPPIATQPTPPTVTQPTPPTPPTVTPPTPPKPPYHGYPPPWYPGGYPPYFYPPYGPFPPYYPYPPHPRPEPDDEEGEDGEAENPTVRPTRKHHSSLSSFILHKHGIFTTTRRPHSRPRPSRPHTHPRPSKRPPKRPRPARVIYTPTPDNFNMYDDNMGNSDIQQIYQY